MKENTKDKILNWIIYICFGLTLLWIILKMFGAINTPIYIEMLPYITALGGLFVFIYKVMAFTERLKSLIPQFNRLTKHVDNMAIGLTNVELRLDALENGLKEFKRDFRSQY